MSILTFHHSIRFHWQIYLLINNFLLNDDSNLKILRFNFLNLNNKFLFFSKGNQVKDVNAYEKIFQVFHLFL